MYEPNDSIPQRELRNNISSVLSDVEAGKSVTVTVHGRPVAELSPIEGRPQFINKEKFLNIVGDAPLDSDFISDIDQVLNQTIDEL